MFHFMLNDTMRANRTRDHLFICSTFFFFLMEHVVRPSPGKAGVLPVCRVEIITPMMWSLERARREHRQPQQGHLLESRKSSQERGLEPEGGAGANLEMWEGGAKCGPWEEPGEQRSGTPRACGGWASGNQESSWAGGREECKRSDQKRQCGGCTVEGFILERSCHE